MIKILALFLLFAVYYAPASASVVDAEQWLQFTADLIVMCDEHVPFEQARLKELKQRSLRWIALAFSGIPSPDTSKVPEEFKANIERSIKAQRSIISSVSWFKSSSIVKENEFREYCKVLDQRLAKFSLMDEPRIVDALQKTAIYDIEELPAVWRKAVKLIIPSYLKNVDLSIRRYMIAEYFRVGFKDDHQEYLAAALMGSGPALQKFFQAAVGFGQEDQVKGILKLKSQAPPMPSFEFRDVEENLFGGRVSKNYMEFSKTPISCGTIAQVHKAVNLNGETVAVKILKPSSKRKVDLEAKFYKDLLEAEHKYIYRHVQVIIRSIYDELDFELEAQNAKEGRERFLSAFNNLHHSKNLAVPEVLNVLIKEKCRYAAIDFEFINGKALDKVVADIFDDPASLHQHKHDLYVIMEELSKIYTILISQSFFETETGFFHADLHLGNIMLTKSPEDNSLKFWIIDYGNSGILPKQLVQMYQAMGTFVGTGQYKRFLKRIETYARSTGRYGEANIGIEGTGEAVDNWSLFRQAVKKSFKKKLSDKDVLQEQKLLNLGCFGYPTSKLKILMAKSQLKMETILKFSSEYNIPMPDLIVKMYRGIFSLRGELKMLKEKMDKNGIDYDAKSMPMLVADACYPKLISIVPSIVKNNYLPFSKGFQYIPDETDVLFSDSQE
ncbi:hypothetical protein MP638_005130 [Amoeboaphelidium occidentale]|nr:hypothetical protein MP638_005130 [Amoeboaphelidium occidentale]